MKKNIKRLIAVCLQLFMIISFLPQAYAVELGDLWLYKQSNVTAETGFIKLNKKQSYDGKAALQIYFKNAYTSNTYVKIESTQSITFDTEKTYLFECYAKSIASGSRVQGKLVWDWTSKGSFDISAADWTYVSKTFKPDTTSNKFGIVFENQTNGFIDGLSLRVLDSEGNAVGENLLENGSFELGDFEAAGDVTEVDTEGLDGEVILSWTNPTDEDFTKINIYAIEEDEEKLIMNVVPDGGSTSVRIDTPDNGAIYYFRICSEDSSGNESDGVEIYGAPIQDSFYADPIKAYSGSQEIDSLTGGEILLSANVTNNREGVDFEPVLIVAVYDNMRLTELKMSSQAIAPNSSAQLSASVSIPQEHSNYHIESYLWYNTDTMDSLNQSRIIN